MDQKSNHYALIIVDMQNDFVLPDAPAVVSGAYDTIPKIQGILRFFRNKKWPVFHVTREHRINGSDIEINRLEGFLKGPKIAVSGTKGCEIIEELKPIEGEYHVVKKRFSAFMNTELDFMLRRLGVNDIVVCGTQYPNCIRATIYDGVSYGYRVVLIIDATSAETPEIAQANINDIRNIGVPCLSVKEFIERIK